MPLCQSRDFLDQKGRQLCHVYVYVYVYVYVMNDASTTPSLRNAFTRTSHIWSDIHANMGWLQAQACLTQRHTLTT